MLTQTRRAYLHLLAGITSKPTFQLKAMNAAPLAEQGKTQRGSKIRAPVIEHFAEVAYQQNVYAQAYVPSSLLRSIAGIICPDCSRTDKIMVRADRIVRLCNRNL